MGDLTAHFDSSEFTDAHGRRVRPPDRILWRLEATRKITGRPIRITSFYRSLDDQRALYARLRAADRQAGRRPRPVVVGYHPQRLAVDVRRGDVPLDAALAAGWGGIGVDGRWAVHLDDRRATTPVIFTDRADG